HKDNADLAQNGWFVGFTPRRNPDVVVCVLFQGGEHGKLAARLATQVIKAYVDKRRRAPQKMAQKLNNGTLDVGGFWSAPDGANAVTEKAEAKASSTLQGGRFEVSLSKQRPVLATAAPGMN